MAEPKQTISQATFPSRNPFVRTGFLQGYIPNLQGNPFEQLVRVKFPGPLRFTKAECVSTRRFGPGPGILAFLFKVNTGYLDHFNQMQGGYWGVYQKIGSGMGQGRRGFLVAVDPPAKSSTFWFRSIHRYFNQKAKV